MKETQVKRESDVEEVLFMFGDSSRTEKVLSLL